MSSKDFPHKREQKGGSRWDWKIVKFALLKDWCDFNFDKRE